MKLDAYIRQKKSIESVISLLEEGLIPSKEVSKSIACQENSALDKEQDNQFSLSESSLRECMMGFKKEQLELKHKSNDVRHYPSEDAPTKDTCTELRSIQICYDESAFDGCDLVASLDNEPIKQKTSMTSNDEDVKDIAPGDETSNMSEYAPTNETCTEPGCTQTCDKEPVFEKSNMITSLDSGPIEQEDISQINGSKTHSLYSNFLTSDDEAVTDDTPDVVASNGMVIENGPDIEACDDKNASKIELINKEKQDTKTGESNVTRLESMFSELSFTTINENERNFSYLRRISDDTLVTDTAPYDKPTTEVSMKNRPNTGAGKIKTNVARSSGGELIKQVTSQMEKNTTKSKVGNTIECMFSELSFCETNKVKSDSFDSKCMRSDDSTVTSAFTGDLIKQRNSQTRPMEKDITKSRIENTIERMFMELSFCETNKVRGDSLYSKGMIDDDSTIKDTILEDESSKETGIETRSDPGFGDDEYESESIVGGLVKHEMLQIETMTTKAKRLGAPHLLPIEHMFSELSFLEAS